MHFYLSCTGNLYATPDSDRGNSQCNRCGGYDEYIGSAESKEEALLLFSDEEWNMEVVNNLIETINFSKEYDV